MWYYTMGIMIEPKSMAYSRGVVHTEMQTNINQYAFGDGDDDDDVAARCRRKTSLLCGMCCLTTSATYIMRCTCVHVYAYV